MNEKRDWKFGIIFTAVVVTVVAVWIFLSERQDQIKRDREALEAQIGNPRDR